MHFVVISPKLTSWLINWACSVVHCTVVSRPPTVDSCEWPQTKGNWEGGIGKWLPHSSQWMRVQKIAQDALCIATSTRLQELMHHGTRHKYEGSRSKDFSNVFVYEGKSACAIIACAICTPPNANGRCPPLRRRTDRREMIVRFSHRQAVKSEGGYRRRPLDRTALLQ